jgi:hypothetical protein
MHKLWHHVWAASLIAASIAFGGSSALAAPAAANQTPAVAAAAQPAASGRTEQAHSRSPQSDAQRYAQRERATPQLASFRGGDTVVIGASAVAVILAIVLIIVLI